jgi:Arc/MetJ family transcription regulator
MVNRDLLKEAIADAKAVKETAIVNAKAALEEAFTPYLKERLAAKLAEMDDMDEADEMMEMKEKDMKETYDMEEAKHMNKKEMD